ncbi:MAG: hypothetical protein WCT29_02060 [Candidatus Paceibacterota bacterium]|jgi:hypothetical protein
MEQNFQTSFIPKKPIIKQRAEASRPVNPLLVIALFILFTVLVASGGLYFYTQLKGKNLENMKTSLGIAQTRFEPTKLAELQVLDKRLLAANKVLSQHIAVTPIFEALEDITMKTVRFTSFAYSIGEDINSPIEVKMSGEAVGYRPIALQSDLFAKNKIFIDPVFSNLSLDQNGNIVFDLTFSIDPEVLNYKQTISTDV